MKKHLVIFCAAMMLLGGCIQPEAGGSPKAVTQVVLEGVTYTVDAPYDFNPKEMLPEDFGDYFKTDYDSKTETYKIAEGTQWENEVVHISGEEEGSVIYIIAGVHGDEEAAWRTGELLEKISIRAGDLYVVAPANPWGAAAEPKTRYVYEKQDLNRSFPGNPEGTEAERVADSLFQDVKRVAPDFVLDLHEARVVSEGRDFLGSSLIFTELGDKMDLLLDMILETQAGTLCSESFDYLGPGPAGSVNHSISTELSTPTITVETFRGYPMERRISDQLAIVQYVMRDFGLVE